MRSQFGLMQEPKQPDETFELLDSLFGSSIFTKGGAVNAIADGLDVQFEEAVRRFEYLLEAEHIALIG